MVPGTPLYNGVNIEAAYDNMVNKFRWGGLEKNPDIYFDETSRGMLSSYRLSFTQLIDTLIDEGENEKALTALDKVTTMIPSSAVAYGTDGIIFARAYYRLGEKEKGEVLIADISDRINKNLDWFVRLNPVQLSNSLSDVIWNNITPMLQITNIYQQYDKEKYRIMANDLLQRAQTFYTSGIPYVGDTLLKEITGSSLRGYYSASADDTLHRAMEEETIQKALNMMQQFSPRLLKDYSEEK